jgi:glycosyltransferase involved in cell wall biosynthesis
MKISIITVCLNSEKTLKYTLNSILIQDYRNIEHVIVDGGSTDNTLKILKDYKFKKRKIIYADKSKLYEAINIGIKNSTGKIISILNSDDIYNASNTLSTVINQIKKTNTKIILGNVVYFKDDYFSKIIRFYSSKNFKYWMLKFGIMPPHTGSFIYRSIYKKYGLYNETYSIAGDFEFFLRVIYVNKIKFSKINILVSRMRMGGVSTKNIYSYFVSSSEILRALNENNVKSSLIKTLLRIPSKIKQLFIYNSNKLNSKFKLVTSEHYNFLFKNNFTIIKNINYINNLDTYILSAFNLAFLGSYSNGLIHNSDKLIIWPDGIFIKTIKYNIKKIPGRNIIKYLKIPKQINTIKVFGHLSVKSKNFLKKKFNKEIVNITLPFGDIEEITKKKYLVKNDELIFITLPTPKQEQFAQHLGQYNKKYKIICIGGSIAIASGEEKVVPIKIYYLEFIWRLRYDTLRRINRLIKTFILFLYGRYLTNKINKISISIAK